MIGKTVYHERLSDPGTLMAVSSRVSGVPGDKHLSTVYLYGNCMLTGIFNCLEHLLLWHFKRRDVTVYRSVEIMSAVSYWISLCVFLNFLFYLLTGLGLICKTHKHQNLDFDSFISSRWNNLQGNNNEIRNKATLKIKFKSTKASTLEWLTEPEKWYFLNYKWNQNTSIFS